MTNQELSQLWDKFDKGDSINDEELLILIRSADEGLCYLRARREYLALCKTSMDLERLYGYQKARKLR